MRYIYDILVNFNDIYFDFYDWNDDDNIIHIKKIPILKVSSDFLNSVKYSSVIVDDLLLGKIYRKTDFFSVNKNEYCYVCCLCDGREAFVVDFNSKGCVVGRSSMLIDEENEVIDLCECMDFCNYNVVVNSDMCTSLFKTRYEIDTNKSIMKQLKFLNDEELCYLYFDCFDENESDVDKVFTRIISEIDCNFDYIYTKVNDFLGLISINK